MDDNTILTSGDDVILKQWDLDTYIQIGDDNKPIYTFQTHSDGTTTAKTPMDCFDEDYIPNDLQYVIDKIKEYDA